MKTRAAVVVIFLVAFLPLYGLQKEGEVKRTAPRKTFAITSNIAGTIFSAIDGYPYFDASLHWLFSKRCSVYTEFAYCQPDYWRDYFSFTPGIKFWLGKAFNSIYFGAGFLILLGDEAICGAIDRSTIFSSPAFGLCFSGGGSILLTDAFLVDISLKANIMGSLWHKDEIKLCIALGIAL